MGVTKMWVIHINPLQPPFYESEKFVMQGCSVKMPTPRQLKESHHKSRFSLRKNKNKISYK
jgi:hypothetical protein